MPTVPKHSGSFLRLGAVLLSAAWLSGCAGDEPGSETVPTLPAGTGGTSAGAAGVPSAGTGTGLPAGSGAAPTGTAGRPPAVAGMPAMGVAGRGAAGMMAAPDAGTPDAGVACGSESPDGDRDGTPDCMDMCPMNAAKTAPGMCGCGKADTDANMNGTPDCTDMPGGQPTPIDPEACKVGPIPADVRTEYKLDPFYTRFASAAGTPIVATNNPVDEAITRACRVVLDLSSKIPSTRQRMMTDHVYFIMMAKNEKTVQTPEYRSRGDLDARARGFGNNPGLCAEENVMCDRTTDRWRGESICVHEYAHVMHLYVWNKEVPMFNTKVNAAYQNAVRTMGKYKNTYAASNATEYFGEIVQNWYNTNLQSSRGEAGDGVHNHINTRAELKEYDPMGYELVSTVLPDMPAYKDCYYYE